MPIVSQAWWNEDWKYRKQLTIDVTGIDQSINGKTTELPLLIRLHSGNFGYFMDVAEGAADVRFIAGDDKTPLKYHIEKFDPINEMALIWVKVPRTPGAVNTGGLLSETVYLYYGNPSAVAADDTNGTYDVNQTLVYHFEHSATAPKDMTAYANNPSFFNAETTPTSYLAGGVKFAEESTITIPNSPTLTIDPAMGWSFSAWIKIDKGQPMGTVFSIQDESSVLKLFIQNTSILASYTSIEENTTITTPETVVLTEGSWHNVNLVVAKGELQLFLDGLKVAVSAIGTIKSIQGDITLGADEEGNHIVGEMDEVTISNSVRPEIWYISVAANQAIGSNMIGYGEDEISGGESTSYFKTILENVSTDGWVIITALSLMAAVSWLVIFGKIIVLNRTAKDNSKFLEKFRMLTQDSPDALDHEETEDEKELAESPLVNAVFGKHDHFQSSTMYHIYHIGIKEMNRRLGRTVSAMASDLSPQAINAIKASVDAGLVRETQKLNRAMVLLTIAISGGPFLGLLGTVMGVMITFAAIAATGDVNINAIAPGVSAALMTTVAGLAVAIPALFAYNYLSTRIRDLTLDTRVFLDEFIALISEYHS